MTLQKPQRYRTRLNEINAEYQLGGIIGSIFSQGFGSGLGRNLIETVGNSLRGFEGEPALKNVFGQSDRLFKGFQEQLKDSGRGDLDISSMKPLFDIATIFSQGMFGGMGFEHGGVVGAPRYNVKKRLGELAKGIEKTVVEAESGVKMQKAKDVFNQKYSSDMSNVQSIIPGMAHKPRAFKKGGDPVSNKIRKLMTEGKKQEQAVAIALSMQRQGKLQLGGSIPRSQGGQFAFPGQPVVVPTPNGQINMNGVNQSLLAIDQLGNSAVLPPNSGQYQFFPGDVLEIPVEKKTKRSRSKKPMGLKMPSMPETSRRGRNLRPTTPDRTSRNFRNRNEQTMRNNKAGNVNLPYGIR